MQYLQVILITAGVLVALTHFGKNHLDKVDAPIRLDSNQSLLVAHYNWLHPRFLTLGISILSCVWLLVWPIYDTFRHSPVAGIAILAALVVVTMVCHRLVPWWKKYLIAFLCIPIIDLLVGGMPQEMSVVANLAIINIAPTLYIFHHNSGGLRKTLGRDDIQMAYLFWVVGHGLAYWGMISAAMGVSVTPLMWLLLHPKQLSLTVVGVFLLYGAWKSIGRITGVFSSVKSIGRQPSEKKPQFFINEPF